MYQRDYFLRMIEMLAQAVAAVLGKKDSKSIEDSLFEIDQAGKMYVGLDSRMIASFADEDLIALFHSGGTFDTNKCVALSEFLYAEARILELRGDNAECLRRYQRSLHFLLEAVTEDPDISAGIYEERITELRQRLQEIILPAPVQKKLFRYYELQKAYGKAEDILFELFDAYPHAPRTDGIEFYKRLLQKEDADLNQGNLPRDEVEAGLRELMEQLQT